MRKSQRLLTEIVCFGAALFCVTNETSRCVADEALLKAHCSKCHSGKQPKGDFALNNLGKRPDKDSADLWLTSLDYVKAGEMPPAKQSRLSKHDRARLVRFLADKVRLFEKQTPKKTSRTPRRLNNRELANSVRDVLQIEDVGSHQPMASLLGDTLHDGFDTNADALGMSEYHLEQYISSFRKIVDATVLSGNQPESQRIEISSENLRLTDTSNRRRGERANRTPTSIEILDMRKHVYFSNFETVQVSGRYRLKIRAAGIDRNVYDSSETGHHKDDPIRLRVHLGDRLRDFDLPDEKTTTIEIDEWLAAGTKIRLSYPTDALTLQGNGNFKFQYRIAHDYLKEHNPDLYEYVVKERVPKAKTRSTAPGHWVHWTEYWQGPRPRLFDADVEGPIYESWPPKRQVELLGKNPTADNASNILEPIAERAWRRKVDADELAPIVQLVQSKAKELGDVEALKEGIVAILVSPSFLLIDTEDGEPADHFATKFSYFLKSTSPSMQLRQEVRGGQLNSFESIRAAVQQHFNSGQSDEFLREFPNAWLQLDRINFMAPDPDRYPLYHRKRISEDMIGEVHHFFKHAIKHNVPVPELLSADYSFINADLANVYGVENVPPDSKFRKYTFKDGRRGGLLGMGAFLTLTADSSGTSPIHRAIYVMENFMGTHPSPPPADVNIEEPDVRQAKTIKEILEAHRSEKTCAACHRSIDPYGYAFENFDPIGAWRDVYPVQDAQAIKAKLQTIPVDASSKFRNGTEYHDIVEFRQQLQSATNRDRFVRCFVKKLLAYANGVEPDNYTEVENIVKHSAKHDYRIVETIAAVIHSPLFRGF